MSRYDALWSLHLAVVAALAADPRVLAQLPNRVTVGAGDVPPIYSGSAPDTAPMPRVVLGLTTGGRFDAFGEAGAEPSIQVDAWAPGPGYDLITPLAAWVCAVLDDNETLTLPAPAGGWSLGVTMHARNVACEIVTILTEPDNVTMHAVCRLSCTLAPT